VKTVQRLTQSLIAYAVDVTPAQVFSDHVSDSECKACEQRARNEKKNLDRPPLPVPPTAVREPRGEHLSGRERPVERSLLQDRPYTTDANRPTRQRPAHCRVYD
jgi:hypothetical protein